MLSKAKTWADAGSDEYSYDVVDVHEVMDYFHIDDHSAYVDAHFNGYDIEQILKI